METNKDGIKTDIFYYRFNISDPKERKQYKQECIKAKSLSGFKEPDTLHYINFAYSQKAKDNLREFMAKIKTYKTITIETKYLYNNQFNTKEGFRGWYWREMIYENPNIKEGYYIVNPQELKDLLNNTFSCGFCGKQYTKEQHKTLSFCNSCLDSEYLKQEELFLLRLKAISDKSERLPLNDCDKAVLTETYKGSQIFGNNKRGKDRLKALRDRLLKDKQKAIKDINKKYNGFIWCLDNGIKTDNLIYYNHTDIFSFGWRDRLTFEQEQELKGLLKYFPYNYEIKV
jgi:hypothetical protein